MKCNSPPSQDQCGPYTVSRQEKMNSESNRSATFGAICYKWPHSFIDPKNVS